MSLLLISESPIIGVLQTSRYEHKGMHLTRLVQYRIVRMEMEGKKKIKTTSHAAENARNDMKNQH